jgi:hypothetical protein
LTIALHVSGVTITHFQEHKTTVTTASGNRYNLLLFAAIVEELEDKNTQNVNQGNTMLCKSNLDLNTNARADVKHV